MRYPHAGMDLSALLPYQDKDTPRPACMWPDVTFIAGRYGATKFTAAQDPNDGYTEITLWGFGPRNRLSRYTSFFKLLGVVVPDRKYREVYCTVFTIT